VVAAAPVRTIPSKPNTAAKRRESGNRGIAQWAGGSRNGRRSLARSTNQWQTEAEAWKGSGSQSSPILHCATQRTQNHPI
jgi:hypothetical protein